MTRRRDPRQIVDYPECIWMLPNDGPRLYALGLPGGVVKLGVAGQPQARIKKLLRETRACEWVHVSAAFGGRRFDTERRALHLAASRSNRLGRTERFIGLSREQALACIREAIQAAG